jgi:TRAP-type mannitol/chloroaromatic compound transport system permease large subunit
VAFTFAGVAVIFGVLTQGVDLFGFMPYRIMSVMQNTILMAVPLFIFVLAYANTAVFYHYQLSYLSMFLVDANFVVCRVLLMLDLNQWLFCKHQLSP